jgi:DNA polymerase-3 subunit delta'
LATLEEALQSGRIHHAWIFAGPLGVGKFTAALEFAKVLMGAAPSGDNRASRMIEDGTHPDLHIIRRDLAPYSISAEIRRRKLSNIPVDLLREHMVGGMVGDHYVEPKVFHSPRLAPAKVFIIDEAELLDAHGQNSLLKTLEEPPKHTYIMLITTQPDRLLPTIRSRAQRIAFLPLDPASMTEWWKRSGLEEAMSPEVREWIDRFAEGSPGMAAMAVEDGLYEWRGAIEPILREAERGRFVAGAGEAVAKLVDSFAKSEQKEDDTESKELANRDGARRVFLMMSAIARRRLGDTVARSDDAEPWLRTIDLIAEAERQIAANVNMKFVFEDLIAQWTDQFAPAGAGAR